MPRSTLLKMLPDGRCRIGTQVNKLSIRKMEAEDLDKVLSIAATSILNPWSKNMFLGELAHSSSHCFLISFEMGDHKETPLGFICFRNLGEESELLNICIDPLHRQKGLGKILMEFYMEFGRQEGVKKYYLEVNPENISALRLYQSFAYQPTGERKKFYQGKYDALLMER